VLVGPPGAGKTTVGGLLAHRLGVLFRDTDADVEERAGKTVTDVFVEDGEAAFRGMEVEAVAAALTRHAGVLALGGGAVMADDTRRALAGHRVVFLDVDLPSAARRVGLNRDRPVLIGNPRAQLRTLLDARRPLYEEVATVTVDTGGQDAEAVTDEVLRLLGEVPA
jgi:shikimate kinase